MRLHRKTPRVVAAVTADVQPRIRAILSGCDVRFVHSGSDLVRALDEARCQIMIVEVHFNESAAAAALNCVLAREETFPVVCVRDVPADEPGHVALNALRMAVAGVVVRDFIELGEHCDDENGNAHVRGRFERLLERSP